MQHVMRRAWWLDWKRDLKLFIRCCAKCESRHRGQPPKQANLRPMLVGSPGEQWCSLLISVGHILRVMAIVTALCPFSKFSVAMPIRNKEASTVAKEHVFLRWGLCSQVLSDLGPEFQAELMTELLRLLDVTRLRSSEYKPSTNGVCDVRHRTLHSMMSKVVQENQRDWSTWLAYITFCYNATEHSATGFPPFFIFTERMPLWTIDLTLPETQTDEKHVPEYSAQVVERLKKPRTWCRRTYARRQKRPV